MGCKKLHTGYFTELTIKHRAENLTLKNSSKNVHSETGYKFNAKELDEETGNYYYGARYYDPKWSIWLSVDPMAEEFPSWNPYVYTHNNPLRYTDPTGMSADDVIITGNKQQETFQELQKSVEGELTLTMDSSGKVTVDDQVYGPLSKGANDLLDAINDKTVNVNVSGSDDNFLSDKSAPLLGAFMGNEVKNGGLIIDTETFQELNPEALGRMDNINKKPGQTTLHEVTESYLGGTIAQGMGKGVGKATQQDSNNSNSVYRRSHDNVIPQSGNIFDHFFDKYGNEVFRGNPNFKPVRLEYRTGDIKNQKTFHSIPVVSGKYF